MDAFESLVATLLQSQGYWTATSFKVDLTKQDKVRIGLPTCPRWEIDVVAYSGRRNEIVAVECKSFLDSTGVIFKDGRFQPPKRYKLFTQPQLRKCVLARLARQLADSGATRKNPNVILALAAGKIARQSDRPGLERQFRRSGWRLFDEAWINKQLRSKANVSYENEVAHVCAKLLLRGAIGDD